MYDIVCRDTMPRLETFFEEALEQMDPEAQVEDEYRYGRSIL